MIIQRRAHRTKPLMLQFGKLRQKVSCSCTHNDRIGNHDWMETYFSSSDVNADVINEQGATPLFLAASTGQPYAVYLLLQQVLFAKLTNVFLSK